MNRQLSLLIVEDSESDAELVFRQFKKAGYDTSHERVETAAEMRSALEKQSWDLVIADYNLPKFDAPSALVVLQESGLDIPFIVVSGVIGEESAVALMKAGAHDYIKKDNLARLIPAVDRELSEAQTRRKKQEAEGKLRESENRFRSIFDNSADGILLTLPDGTILNANAAACHMLGRNEEEIRRVGRAGIVDLSDPRFAAALEERKRTGEFKSEYFHVRKNGTKFLCEVSSSMFKNKDGQSMTCTIFRDITERKRMEQNIERAAEEWRTTFDSIEDMVMNLDIDYRILRTNKTLVSFLGLSYGDILGMHLFDLIHWIKQPPEKCPFARMLHSRKHEELETYIDEKEIWVAISADPVFDEHKNIAGGIYIIKNITDRKKTDIALRESEERYRIAIENSNDGIGIAKAGKHLFVNRRFLEMFGYDRFEDILKTEAHVVVHPDDRERVRGINLRRMAGEPVPAKYEFKGVKKDGTPIDIEASVAPIVYLGSDVSLIFFRDITEQKRNEEILRNSQKDLQTIMDAEPIAISWAGIDKKFQYLNKRFVELFGYTLEDVPTVADWYSVAYPDEAERKKAISLTPLELAMHIQREPLPKVEREITCKDGTTRYVEIMGVFAANKLVVMYNDITERRRMEEELRENERQLQSLMDNLPVAVTWSAIDGTFKYINRKFHELFGYTLEDIPNIQTWKELTHPDQTSREAYDVQVALQRERISQGLSPIPIETMMICKDGSQRFVAGMGAIVSNLRIAIYIDLTERKQMEETLRNSQQELQTIMDFAPVAFTWSDMDGNIQYINKAFHELFGYALEDLSTTDEWRKKVYPSQEALDEYNAKVLERRKKIEQGEMPAPIEVALICKDGSTRHVMASGGTTPNRRLVIYTDITERIKMEEALHESQKQLQTIMDAAPVPVSWADIETKELQYVNNKFIELFGYTLEDIPTLTHWRRSAYQDAKDVSYQPIIDEYREGGSAPVRERVIICKDGSERFVQLRGVFAANKMVVIFTDLTEQKRAEEALRESENKFRDLVEKSIVGVYLIQDNVFKYVNARFAEIHGYTIEELVDKKSLLDLVPPEDESHMLADIQNKRNNNVTISFQDEISVITKKGEIRIVSIYVTDTIFQGKPATIGTFVDITEQEFAEELLKESESKFRDLVEKSFVGVYLIQDNVFKYVNARFAEIHGYTIDEMVDKMGILETTLPEDTEEVNFNIQKRSKGEVESSQYEFRIVTKQREIKNVIVYGTRTMYRGKPASIGTLLDITEQRRAEELLRESEKKFRDLVEKSIVGVYLVQDRLFRYVNKQFAEIHGYTIEELVDKKGTMDTILPEDISKMLDNAKARFQGKIASTQNEFRIVTKQREIRNVVAYGTQTMYLGKPATIGTLLDITEQKHAEEALRESEDKFRGLADKSFVGIYLLQDNVFRYVNARFAEIHGYTVEELVDKKSILELSPPEDIPKLLAEMKKRVTGRDESVKYGLRVITKQGEIKNVEIYVSSTMYKGKTATIGTLIDVTEQKRAEIALKESENKFRDLVEKSIVGVFLIQDEVFRYVNQRFAEIHGYTIEEIVDKKGTSEMVILEDAPKVNDVVRRDSRGDVGLSQQDTFRIVTKQGEIKIVQVYGTDTTYRGKPAIIGTLIDITEQKHAEEMLMDLFKDLEKKNAELEQTYDDLRESQQKIIQQEKMASIGQLAAGIAHEINNPVGFVMSNLNSMGKYSEKLSQFIKIQSEAIEKLSVAGDAAGVLESLHKKRRALKIDYVANDLTNVIKESLEGTERVKRIVQDLKNFSHKDEEQHKPASINEGIESTINVVWNELKYKADVKKEYGKIPLTKCNIGQLNQVFMNLLVNAAHAIEEHGEISIRTEHRDGDIVVSVSDTGSGIPEDKISRIFEPFFTTKEVGQGTGLGLSIAYDIVKKHNGEILVASEVGKGSTFTVKIPIVER